jgi:hypothetical protein
MRYATDAAPPIRYDWATGLYSRWYLDAVSEETLADAFCKHLPAFVVRLTAAAPGHAKRLAEWLRTQVDLPALAGVVGAGAFAVLFTETSRRDVLRFIDRARSAVGVPIEAAVAEFPDDGLTFEALLLHAARERDSAMVA